MCLLYPLLEPLDPWDSPDPSSDAEIQLIAVFTFVGIMLVLARVLATLVVSFVFVQGIRYLCRHLSAVFQICDFSLAPPATVSPPIPLRI